MATQLEINEITAIYEDILFRAPDPDGLNFWVGVLDRGLLSLQGIVSAFTTTTEALTVVDPIIRLYDGLFGRVPEISGLQNWVAAEEHGESFDSIVQYFVGSQEFANDYNAGVIGTIPGADGPLFISELYEHLLGRNYDAPGLAYWEGILGSTPTIASEAKVVEGFVNSAEFIKDTQNGIISWETTGVDAALANTTSTTIGTPVYPTTIVNTGLIQNLTPGIDTINAGVTVDGSLSNLGSEDLVANVTNLNLTDDNGGDDILPAFLPGFGLSNVWNLTLTTDGNAGENGIWFSTTGISNLRSVTVTSVGDGIDLVQAASTTNVLVTHLNSGGPGNSSSSSDSSDSSNGGGVEVIGGQNVTIVNDGGWGVVVGNDSGSGIPVTGDMPTGAVNVTQNASLYGDVHIFGGTNVTVTATSDSYEGTIDIGNTGDNTGNFVSGGDVNPTGAIVVTDAAEWGGDEPYPNGGADGYSTESGTAYSYDGNITIYGGSSVTVTAAGDYIQVGDPSGNTASNNTTGDVTITDTAPFVWGDPEQGGQEEDVYVVGGHNILVTTNTGDVTIGDYYEVLNASNTALAGTQPTGTVTVFDSAIESYQPSPPTSPPGPPASETGDCCCATWTGPISCVEVDIYGGTTVDVTATDAFIYIGAIAENGDGDFVVNSAGDYVVLAPTGNITINDGTAEGYTSTALGSLGSTTAEANIYVLGGATINITTDVGNVTVGTCVLNPDGTPIAGAEPTGTVTVTDDSAFSGSTVKIYGGTGVTVNATGAQVDIGKIVWNDGTGTVVAPSGTTTVDDNGDAIVVNDVSTTVYDNIINTCAADVTIVGSFDGNGVSVTTNVGGVYIGSDCDVSGANPTGDVTVVDNATGLWVNPCFQSFECTPYVEVIGGANVTITVNDASIQVGDYTVPGATPTGLVDITVNGIQTANQYDNIIEVDGAGAGVTINVTGVADYGCEPAILVGTATSIDTDDTSPTLGVVTPGNPVVGPVQITDTHSGWNYGSEDIVVIGGSGADTNGFAVDISTGLISCSTIWVGECPTTNLGGTAFINIGDYTTGNVSISQVGISNGSTVYGDAYDDVYLNGGTLVVLTGGDGATIVDVNSLEIPNGPDAGDYVGTSTLTTVTLDGVSGDICITADALTILNISDNVCDPDIYINNNNPAPTATGLTINLSNDDVNTYVDDVNGTFGGTLTINSNGTAPNSIDVDFSAVTALVVNATAAIDVDVDTLTSVTAITVTGTGAVEIDNTEWGALKSIDATGSSGGVTVEIQATQTSFAGGSGPDVVTLDSTGDTFDPTLQSIDGGTGSNNTIIVTNIAVDYGATAAIGADVTHFQTLEVNDSQSINTDYTASELYVGATDTVQPTAPFYDAAGFSHLAVAGAGSDGIAFFDVTAGVDLTLLQTDDYTVSGANQNLDGHVTIGYDLATASATASLTVHMGVAGTPGPDDFGTEGITDYLATGAGGGSTLPAMDGSTLTGSIATVTINSLGDGYGENTLYLTDAGFDAGKGTGTTTIDITGNEALALNDQDGTITTVDAGVTGNISTGDIDLSGMLYASTGVTITGGAGFLTADTDDANSVVTSVDQINVGTGGGIITVGGGGAGAFSVTHGNEAITLSTSPTDFTAVVLPEFPLNDGENGPRVNITNFKMGGPTADVLAFAASPNGTSTGTYTQESTAALAGDYVSGDKIGVTIDSGNAAFSDFSVQITVGTNDPGNLTLEAEELATAINTSATAIANHISAVYSGNTVTLIAPASEEVSYTQDSTTADSGVTTVNNDDLIPNTPVVMANEVSIHAPGSLAIYQSVDGVLTATSGTATLADAVAIVDEEGVGTLAAVTIGANTYVIENNGGTLNSDESNTALASADTIVTLTGVSNVDGFAWVGAALADLGQYTPISSAGQSISITADPGQTWQNVTDFTDTGSAAPGTTTYYETIDHTSTGVPGAFAGLVLDTAATGSTIQYLDVANWGFMEVGGTSGIDTNNVTGGNVEVSQVGTGAEFGLIANNGGFTLNGFTYDNGASGGTLIIDPLDGNIVLGQLTDAGPLLVITGGDDVTIGTAASTGFTFGASNDTFIDAQSFTGDLHLGTEALPVTGGDLTIDVTDGFFGPDAHVGGGATIFAKGDGDIINVGNVDSVTMPWDTEETGSVVIQAGGQGDTISVNIDCSGPGPGALVGAAGNGDHLTLVGGYGVNVPLSYPDDDTVVLGVISAAGNKDSAYDLATDTLINVDVSGSGVNCDLAVPLGSQDVSLGTGDVIQIGDPSGNNCDTTAIAWLGGDNTVTIGYGAPADGSSLGADGTITADIWVSGAGDETGATISNTATDLSGITHETISWDGCANLNLFFFNEANESLAGCTWANSVVNVSTVNAPTLGAALNIAATQAAVLDQNFADGANTSTAGGTLAIDHSTGLIDWFQYGGNTYIVEANNNSTTAAAAHTALGSHDVVIELIGLVNPGDIGINHAYHTVAI